MTDDERSEDDVPGQGLIPVPAFLKDDVQQAARQISQDPVSEVFARRWLAGQEAGRQVAAGLFDDTIARIRAFNQRAAASTHFIELQEALSPVALQVVEQLQPVSGSMHATFPAAGMEVHGVSSAGAVAALTPIEAQAVLPRWAAELIVTSPKGVAVLTCGLFSIIREFLPSWPSEAVFGLALTVAISYSVASIALRP